MHGTNRQPTVTGAKLDHIMHIYTIHCMPHQSWDNLNYMCNYVNDGQQKEKKKKGKEKLKSHEHRTENCQSTESIITEKLTLNLSDVRDRQRAPNKTNFAETFNITEVSK